ncbi:MAG: acetate kinase [Acidobacteriota bacterium]
MNILVLNCGSSSVKFQIIATDLERIRRDDDLQLARGLLEGWGDRAQVRLQAGNRDPVSNEARLRNQPEAIEEILRWIGCREAGIDGIHSISDIHAVGHRVVHGGERFRCSVRIDDEILAGIEECIELAPLHNNANLEGIHAVADLLGEKVPQVAVFDTAFHTTMPETSFLYGIPYEQYSNHKIRRYGFHGTSHHYVSERYRALLGLPREEVNIITLHLGNGCSACAIKNGESFDTSMGFTPLEGLLMGTRCGDIDASILGYLSRKKGMSLKQVETMLNEASGLRGLSGSASDMRILLEQEKEGRNRQAGLAIEIFCYRVQKYVGAYFVALGRANAIVFTGGIGENAPDIRRRICIGLRSIGLQFDAVRNESLQRGECGEISKEGSPLRAFVIPTNEELLIARETYRVVTGASE